MTKSPRFQTLAAAAAMTISMACGTDVAQGSVTADGLALAVQTVDDRDGGWIAARRTCPLGHRYSSYYRRCVWWLPVKG